MATAERFDPTAFLSPAEIRAVSRRSDVKALLCIAHAWIVIAVSIALFAAWPNPLTFILAIVLIGGRQLGLAILMHDGAHGILTGTRSWNDPVSQWFAAFPIFADTLPYRYYHLVHHRKTQQPDDPDLSLSAPFPISRASLRRKMIRDITGQTGFRQRRAQIRAAFGKPGRPLAERWAGFRRKLGGPIVANLILLGAFSAFGRPHYYFLFWLLPLLTWYMVILRIRNIAEHAVVPDNNNAMKNARTTYASWWERALVAPYWVNYHVDHHLMMYVPCYNLPKLHGLLLAKGLGSRMEIRDGYASILAMATSKPELLPQAA